MSGIVGRVLRALFLLLLSMTPAMAAPDAGELMAAAKIGDVTKVRRLLAEGASPDDRGPQQVTALMIAVENKHNDVVQTLLAASADANAARGFGISAMHVAASTGNTQAVSLLLAAHANIDAPIQSGLTPLLLSLRDRQWDTAKALLAGANLMATAKGEEALALALRIDPEATYPRPYLDTQFAQKLIDLGAKPEKTLADGSSALLSSAGEQQTEMIAFLLQKGLRVDEPNNKGETPLLAAAKPTRAELLTSGLLFIAGGMSQSQYQEWVLNYDRDGAPSSFGRSEMADRLRNEVIAVHARRKKALEQLLAAGANPNLTNKEGLTPVMAAIQSIDRPALEVLLNGKADPNAPFKDSQPLLRVIEDGRLQSVRLLLAHGADPSRPDKNGITPLGMAQKKGYREIIAALKAAGAQ